MLTWTSDDNSYTPDAIEQMVRFLCTYPDVDFVYSDAYEIDAEGKVVGMLWVPLPEWLQVKNRVGGSFMYRRGVYRRLATTIRVRYWPRTTTTGSGYLDGSPCSGFSECSTITDITPVL